ncbi:MAG TPA: hypothetical protein VIW24_19285 [Aldersonia sp.]
MIFPIATIDAIAAGDVSLAFRRWTAPRVKPGTRITNKRGVVEIVSVQAVDTVTDDDARAAGFDDAAGLLALVDKKSRAGGTLYRIGVRFGGADPRQALRAAADLSGDEVADLTKRLDRMDAAADEPWTRQYLQLVADNPAVVSTTLAAEVAMPRPDFKLRVRRLKNLGLTESLEVGYRISPRGAALLGRLGSPV